MVLMRVQNDRPPKLVGEIPQQMLGSTGAPSLSNSQVVKASLPTSWAAKRAALSSR